MKTTVIYHSADFDGLFCREIAKKFLPEAELVGWDFGDAPLKDVPEGPVYILDLPVDKPLGLTNPDWIEQSLEHGRTLIWIDHHKSSIESHPKDIPGYRIDGVAACRLAWQWFSINEHNAQNQTNEALQVPLPGKQEFINRTVSEPHAVRLAGEYDVWDKRDPDAELFQHGLRSRELTCFWWNTLLAFDSSSQVCKTSSECVLELLEAGKAVQYAKTKENESIITHQGFTLQWEGLTFLACNHARYNSFLFTAGLKPEHDACFGFKWAKGKWEVSLYHAPGKEHHDLSVIAAKHGGGGHRGACGFRAEKLPFL